VPSPEPLQPYRRVQAKAEEDLLRILEATAKAIQKRIGGLPSGVGGDIRKSQLIMTLSAIRKMQRAMWLGPIGSALAQSVVDAEEAAEIAIETMTRVAYGALGKPAADALILGLRLAAQSGLKSDSARRKRELSERVYRQASIQTGKVEDLIRQGIISKLSARELAATVYEHISPTTKGGASYAALRLARTEINNAFHGRQLEGAKRPGITGAKWNLSGSHRVPDECNVYAAFNGDGVYPVDDVPEKPHPQCFCFLTYETMSSDDFQKSLAAGDFDAEIDRRTRANLQRLGAMKPPALTKAKRRSRRSV
jgi:hypothetical protein